MSATTREPPDGRGLEASQHAAVHPQRQQNIDEGRGRPRDGGWHPPTQGHPQKPQQPSAGPQGQQTTQEKQTVSETIQKNTLKLAADIQEALDSYQAQTTSSLLPLLQRAQQALLHQAHCQAIDNTLSTIQRDLQKQQPAAASTTATWAQKAQIQPTMPRLLPQPQASNQTVTIRMGNPEEREAIKRQTNEDLRKKIGAQKAAAVQKLPSGDIRVVTYSTYDKAKMEEDSAWLQELWPQATVSKPMHRVVVHGVRAGWQLEDKASWGKMEEENLRWLPNLRIEQAVWLKSPMARKGQQHSSAIVAVQNEEQARAITKKGLLHAGTVLMAEPYHPKQRVVQCLKCCQFGHISPYCKEDRATCGKCAGPHKTADCTSTTHKCSNCKGAHPTWSVRCKVKQAAKAKAQAFSHFFTKRWEEPKAPATQSGWTQVHNKKRKGTQLEPTPGEAETQRATSRPGRPRGSTAIAKAGERQASKIRFPQSLHTDNSSQEDHDTAMLEPITQQSSNE